MNNTNTQTIYRYKFNTEVMNEIAAFSKIHQYDDRHTYKEAWNMWKDNQRDIVDAEIERLTGLGYTGSVEDKMYKAGRYYFRKKPLVQTVEKQERRGYISMDGEVLIAMDAHIRRIMGEDNFTPASGYTDFCEKNLSILDEEIRRICRENPTGVDLLVEKFKKTYKNRYYLLSRSRN
jgi:hypothetical protein